MSYETDPDILATIANFKPEPCPPVTDDPASWGRFTSGRDLAAIFQDQIKGKTVLLTGVAPGSLAAFAAELIALHAPRLLILSARSTARLEPVVHDLARAAPGVPVRTLAMDLGSVAAVRAAATALTAWAGDDGAPLKLDVLICSAAVMAAPWGATVDGVETQFAVGHLGHFVFANTLLRNDVVAPGGRIVCVSSHGHRLGPVRLDDINFENGAAYDPWAAYGQAKTANILYARALATKATLRQKHIVACSLHPGGSLTNLSRHISMASLKALGALDDKIGTPETDRHTALKSVDQSVSTYMATAFGPFGSNDNGAFFDDCHVREPIRDWADSDENAAKLWELSEQLAGEKFDL